MTSLMIGAVAGLLGAISLQAASGLETPMGFGPKDLLMLASIGYAGADFIEAFVQKQFPSGRVSGSATSTAEKVPDAAGTLPMNTAPVGALFAGELVPNNETQVMQVGLPGGAKGGTP
jgi:hypothetical protein